MDYNIYSVDLPQKEDLTLEQINLLENYELIYKELEKTPEDISIINSASKILVQFYHIFNENLKKKYRYWYKFQITLIDPLMGPCAKLSELITECDLQDKIAITEDGKSIIVPNDEKDFASIKFLKMLNEELPELKIKKIKI